MNDGVDAFEIFRFHVANVANDLPVGQNIGGERRHAGFEIADVETCRPMSRLTRQPCQDGTDETLIAGNKNMHGVSVRSSII